MGNAPSLASRLSQDLDPNTLIRGSIGPLGLSRETLSQKLKPTDGIPSLPDHAEADAVAHDACLLLWAVAGGQARCVSELLKHGADPHLKNGDGVSPLSLSKSQQVDPRIRTLIEEAIA